MYIPLWAESCNEKRKEETIMLFVREKAFYKSFFRMMFVIAMQNVVAYSVNLDRKSVV